MNFTDPWLDSGTRTPLFFTLPTPAGASTDKCHQKIG